MSFVKDIIVIVIIIISLFTHIKHARVDLRGQLLSSTRVSRQSMQISAIHSDQSYIGLYMTDSNALLNGQNNPCSSRAAIDVTPSSRYTIRYCVRIISIFIAWNLCQLCVKLIRCGIKHGWLTSRSRGIMDSVHNEYINKLSKHSNPQSAHASPFNSTPF